MFHVAKATLEPYKILIVPSWVGKIFTLAGMKNACIPLDDRIAQIIAS
jgi:hypothetical protein